MVDQSSTHLSEQALQVARTALLIRRFEELILELYREGKFGGTVHTAIGQEFPAAAVTSCLKDYDFVFSNHRGHGHYIGHVGNLTALLSEILGRSSGTTGGHGGTQHVHDRNYVSNGIVGGMSPIAAGSAWAQKLQEGPGISVLFVGDGALGQGVLYEAMNFAGLRRLPLLIVVETNGMAQSTPVHVPGNLEARAAGFGLRYFHGQQSAQEDLLTICGSAVRSARAHDPTLLQVSTYRLGPHSKGDDTRPAEEVARNTELDPVNQLLSSGALTRDDESHVSALLGSALTAALQGSEPGAIPGPPVGLSALRAPDVLACERSEVTVGHMREGLRQALAGDPTTLLIGEDLVDPYGGAFAVTRGLSSAFPKQVHNMPISEALLVGCATGLSLHGARPIVEIMFGDFLTLTADQIINHLSKFTLLARSLPVVIRTPMGGGRAYGPTHSQSLEKFFIGIPGITVVAPNAALDNCAFYASLGRAHAPTIVMEHKLLYAQSRPDLTGFDVCSHGSPPTLTISPKRPMSRITIVCFGAMLPTALAAVRQFFVDTEIGCELICPSQLYPMDMTPIRESVLRTKSLLTIEEGPKAGGIGDMIVAQLLEEGTHLTRFHRLSNDGIVPAASGEQRVLPSEMSIVHALKGLL